MSVEEPELDSSFTGLGSAEKMISNMIDTEYGCVVYNCEFAAISLLLGVQG